jgi:penicillin-binding protein 2
MPPPTLEERRPPITPQLAVRVAVLGGIAFVAFGIIFFRLWFLQVLSGDEYVSQARENRVRKIRVEAPRGDIVDRHGDKVLVRTREAPVVLIDPSTLPLAERELADAYRKELSAAERERLAAADRLKAIDRSRRATKRKLNAEQREDRRAIARAARRARAVEIPPVPDDPQMRDLFRRLGKVLRMPPRVIHGRVIRAIADAPYANIVVKTGVSRDAYNYLVERKEKFPGVRPDTVFLRHYPHKTLGAQLFGTVREIAPEELEEERYQGLEAGDRVGKDGIEETYDEVLRGEPGYDVYRVNSLGDKDERSAVRRRAYRQGNRLKLTLDLGLQRSADRAMAQAIAAARANGNASTAGAYVAMDPRNGEVFALGSYPSFDANIFAKPVSQGTYEKLIDEERGAPLFNRAISATYPTGSTFKPITAVAAMAEGILTPDRVIVDDGSFELGGRAFKNARDAVYGALSIVRAMQVSSDVFFYTLGFEMDARDSPIQKWARRLGIGRPTGIDLPGEFAGLVPDREWRDKGYREYRRCLRREKVPAGSTQALFACGGIERPWSAGDSVNLSVGQGDLQATPLQMAVAYSSIVNEDGRVPRPHLGMEIQDGAGRTIQEIRKAPARKVSIDPAGRAAIMEGLRAAAMEPGGTSYDVFKGFTAGESITLYGKTGTVERAPNPDQSWYAVYAEHPTRPIVVIVTVEKGGFGAETAAPAARLMLSQWFNRAENEFVQGESKTR